VVGAGDDDEAASLTFTGNGVTALDPENHAVGIGIVGFKGDVSFSEDRIESSRVGLWFERNHGGSINVNNPAMIRSGGVALLAIGNSSALVINEFVVPQVDAAAIAYDDQLAGGDAAVQIGLLLLDNRSVELTNVSALLNPLDLAIFVDRSELANEHYAGLSLNQDASMTAQGLEGPDNSFRSGEMAGVTVEGTGAVRFVDSLGSPLPRGWLRGAP
jgi:hypothetical protein